MENKNEKQLLEEIKALRTRLAEAEETICAIRGGGVDAIVVSGSQGEQVFTLTGAERAYRVLIETMNEGAASLNREGMIIYCNQHLAEMLKTPLEKVIGAPLRRFIRAADLPVFESLMEKESPECGKGEVALINNDGASLPVLLSVSSLQQDDADFCGITVTDLTAQKNIEEELRRHRDNLEELVKNRTIELQESSELNRQVIESAQEGIIVYGPDLKYQIWNAFMVRLTGFSAGEVLGRHPLEVFPFLLEAGVLAGIEKSLTGEVSEVERFQFDIPKAGRSGWVSEISAPLKSAKGEIIGVIETVRDVTEHVRAEEFMLASAREWTEAFDAINDMITIHDADFNIVRANKASESVLGLAMKDILTHKCFKSYHGTDSPPEWCQSCMSLKTGTPSTTELFEPHLDRFVEIKAMPRFDAHHNIIGVVHVVRDITERKQKEQDLQAALVKAYDEQSKSEAIMTSMGEGLSIQDTDFIITYQNQVHKELMGDHIGEHCYTAYENVDHVCEGCSVAKAYRDGGIHRTERTVTTDKGTLHVEITASPLKDMQGNIVAGIEIVRDITEQKKLEEQLRQSQKMETVGTMAGGIAHDFNNILNVIMGYGSMVIDTLEAGTPAKDQMSEVLLAAEKAAVLTRRLLVFSRKQAVDVRPVNINDIILGLQKMLARIIRESTAFTLVLTDSPVIVMADAGQLEQVLINLASNAKDAMPEGGRLTISTEVDEIDDDYIGSYGYGKPGKYVLITVSDTGKGMDAATQKKIFEPFFTTKGIGEGTGLGLAISYGIIKQHNGYIKVYSEIGHGTAFKIYLPLSEEATHEVAW